MTLVWTPGWNGLTEPEAVSYVAAVEAADGQPLEFATAKAINDFVLGCKNDGIWNAIKASCILAGARTLEGALVPLVGTAPTNIGPFVSGDYNRKTGLVGDGSTKRLTIISYSSAAVNGTLHNSTFVSVSGSVNRNLMGANAQYVLRGGASSLSFTAVFGGTASVTGTVSTGFVGATGAVSGETSIRFDGQTVVGSTAFVALATGTNSVFGRGSISSADQRLAFYSIGESLDLARLDARVTDLINAFAVTIP